MSKPVTVESDSFDKIVLQSKTPVLVDFWAPWCGPCRMVAPVIDELSGEYEGKITFGKINIDEEGDLARKYGVMSIPTMILFKDGKPMTNMVGFRPKAELKRSLDAALG